MTAPTDALSGQIAIAGLRVAIERSRAAVIRQLGVQSVASDSPPTLQSIVNIAARQQARIERMTTRALAIDQRGAATEERAGKTYDEHEIMLDAVDQQYDALDRFNSDLRAQLGNDVPTSRGSPAAGAGSSAPSGGTDAGQK